MSIEYVSSFSNDGLLKMHMAVKNALVADDEASKQNKEKQYGVREFPDWKTWSDDLETVLTERGVPFEKVSWNGVA